MRDLKKDKINKNININSTIQKAVILTGNLSLAYTNIQEDQKSSISYDGSTRLLGISLLQRAILSVRMAGIKEIFLLNPSLKELETIKDLIAYVQSIDDTPDNISLVLINPDDSVVEGFLKSLADERFLLLSSNLAFHPDLLKEPGQLPPASLNGHPLISLCRVGQLEDIVKKLNNGLPYSEAYTSGKKMPSSSRDRILVAEQKDLFCQVVADRSSFKIAERQLLETARKPTDGFIYKYLNRPISLRLTRLSLHLIPSITPNQISLTNLIPALAGAFLMMLGGYGNALTGAVLFHLSSVFDGCDGENARLTYRVSNKGAWIDTICDVIAYFAFLIAIPIGLYRFTGNILYPLLGLETVIFIILLYIQMTRYVKTAGSGGSMIKIVKDIENSGNHGGRGVNLHKIVSRCAFIFRRDFFAFGFMVLCIFGALPLLLWLLALLAPFAMGYLFSFSRKKLAESSS
jgi:phosphatidylglycerophosphate synthase